MLLTSYVTHSFISGPTKYMGACVLPSKANASASASSGGGAGGGAGAAATSPAKRAAPDVRKFFAVRRVF